MAVRAGTKIAAGMAATCIAATAFAGAMVAVSGTAPASTGTCDVSQPVYTGTTQTGSWYAALHYGQTVTLPDGDTATCTVHGLDIR